MGKLLVLRRPAPFLAACWRAAKATHHRQRLMVVLPGDLPPPEGRGPPIRALQAAGPVVGELAGGLLDGVSVQLAHAAEETCMSSRQHNAWCD